MTARNTLMNKSKQLARIKVLTSKSVNVKVTANPSVGVCTQQSSTFGGKLFGKLGEVKVFSKIYTSAIEDWK